jgi:predicted ATPase
MLMRRWERVRHGDGQLVLIVGEPGLGKSRLMEEFHTKLRDTPHTWAEWSCSQLLQNTPLHPFAEWGRVRFGSADASPEQRLTELEGSLAQVKLDPAENAALLAPLLDIPLPPERVLTVAPEELRRRQLAALTNWAIASAKVQPLVLSVEDLHWADPTTLDLLRGIAERGALAPLFVLITARPEFRSPWGMRSHHTLIALAPLDRDQVRHMVGELAAQRALPKEVVEGVTERAGGVPLFIEELTRLLLEQGEQGVSKAIPATLQQSLTARLDRLGSARITTALIHVKGYAAPETKAAAERARVLIEQAEALGERLDDSLLLFSVLYVLWGARLAAFNADASRELAMQFLALAEKQRATAPRMIGHRLMGVSLMTAGDIVQGRQHLDEAIAHYDPAAHRPLAMSFGNEPGVTSLSFRGRTLWLLGYPEAALADVSHALNDAREIGHAVTLMVALWLASSTHMLCGNYMAATAEADELVTLTDEKTASMWKGLGVLNRGCLLVLSGKSADAVQMINSGIALTKSTATTVWLPSYLPYLGVAYAELHQFDDACRCVREATTATETTKQGWSEAEVNRLAGEIVLMLPERDAAKAEAYFERALAVARQQQAKSWELRAAMSMSRLWRDQGKPNEARNLLAPVYGWFTEGFDTRDLKEAKALLDELAT